MVDVELKCPFCNDAETKVIDSRESDSVDSVRRRRECEKCERRFTTYERFELSINIVKKDGTIEPFDREKLLKGIRMSCHKRPVSTEQMDKIISDIERELRDEGSSEVLSSKIGSIVMKKLKAVDKVAYIRFASVYHEFEDVDEFSKEILKLETKRR